MVAKKGPCPLSCFGLVDQNDCGIFLFLDHRARYGTDMVYGLHFISPKEPFHSQARRAVVHELAPASTVCRVTAAQTGSAASTATSSIPFDHTQQGWSTLHDDFWGFEVLLV